MCVWRCTNTLIRSHSAACQILNGALRVNPFDVQMTATVLDKALRMEKPERQARR